MEAMSAVAQSARLWNAVAPPAAQVPAEALATIMQTICTVTSATTAVPALATRFLVWQSAGHLLQTSITPIEEPANAVGAEPPARPTSATGKRSRLAEAGQVVRAKRMCVGQDAPAPDEVPSQQELPQHEGTAAGLSDAAEICAEAIAALNSVHGHTVGTSNDGDGLPGLPPSALHALLTAALFCPAEKRGVPQPSRQDQANDRRRRALALCAAAVLGPSSHLPSRATSAGVSGQRCAGLARQSTGCGRRRRQPRQLTSSDPQAGAGSVDGGLESLPVSGTESGHSSAPSDSPGVHVAWPDSALRPDGLLENSSSVRDAFLDHLEPKR